MSWSLSASGHVDSPDAELEVVNKLRACMRDVGAISGLVSTSHTGQVDLLAAQPDEGSEA